MVRGSRHSRKSLTALPMSGNTRSTFGYALGTEAFGKAGWRRVSTRQWIRDFREHISKYQTYPYKPICGALFWSFGYYPDMVSKQSYEKYITKYPLPPPRGSMGSDMGDLGGPVAGHFDERTGPKGVSSSTSTTSSSGEEPGRRKSRKSLKSMGSETGFTESDASLFSEGKSSRRKSKKGASAEDLTTDASEVSLSSSRRKSKRKSRKSLAAGETGESTTDLDEKKKKRKSRKSVKGTASELTTATEGEDDSRKKRKSRKSKKL